MKKENINRKIGMILLFLIVIGYFSSVNAVQPFGANYTDEVTTTSPVDEPQEIAAQAGNVTQLNLYGVTTTQSWQGYYGNVTGAIQLANGDDKVLYNWSLFSPEGEVYASTNGSGEITWGDIACFDLASNHEALETYFNISTDDVDGVNETFQTGNNHDPFYTAGTFFNVGTCPSTQIFDSSGEGNDNHFEEVLLTDESDAVQVVFAALLEEDDVQGFDGEYYDFEMIVLEKGKSADVTATPYYFYVELQ